ncbi:MAG: bifunctional phosphoribosyl-AMP cyclohydrolase/phosphoribosyl-ATP diphosphatase HisIE [Pyrinomonadaceae bacterium]
MIEIEDVKFDERGLVPAVVQDARTREVLTLAYMNAESLARTLHEGETWFWSRSRRELWHKGETSGNTQRVVHVQLDCDQDALVVLVEPTGPACHTGARSCFQSDEEDARSMNLESMDDARDLGATLEKLYAVIESRKAERPEGSYTTYLFDKGLDKILKKVGEESAETIIAAKNEDSPALVSETSDLLYHLMVLLVERGVKLEDVRRELAMRGGRQKEQ